LKYEQNHKLKKNQIPQFSCWDSATQSSYRLGYKRTMLEAIQGINKGN
jgi:hypothetical protein